MNVQTIVTDLTSKVEKLASTGQEAAVIGFDTLKTANEIVVEAAQAIVKTNTDAGTALFAEAKSVFEKASTDGIKAVINNPVGYLPVTTPAVDAFNVTIKTLTETGTELAKTFEGGFNDIVAKFNGETVTVAKAKKAVKAAAAPAAKTVKAAAKKVKAAA